MTRSVSIGEIAVVKAGMQVDVSGFDREGRTRRKHLPGSPWVSFLHQCYWRAPSWTELLSPSFWVSVIDFYAHPFYTVVIWNKNYFKIGRSPFHSPYYSGVFMKTQEKKKDHILLLNQKKINLNQREMNTFYLHSCCPLSQWDSFAIPDCWVYCIYFFPQIHSLPQITSALPLHDLKTGCRNTWGKWMLWNYNAAGEIVAGGVFAILTITAASLQLSPSKLRNAHDEAKEWGSPLGSSLFCA